MFSRHLKDHFISHLYLVKIFDLVEENHVQAYPIIIYQLYGRLTMQRGLCDIKYAHL